MWVDLINTLSDGCEIAPPAGEEPITNAEQRLGVRLEPDLRDLLRECNGIVGPSGTGLVWPIERISRDNLQFRSNSDFKGLYMPFDHLLFIGDDGSGDQYAFRVLEGKIERYSDIYEWVHENDSRTWFAGCLRDYLERSLGKTRWYGPNT